MLQSINSKLIRLGFSSIESKLYLAFLKNGSQTASKIAKIINHDRTSCYRAVEGLLEKGFLTSEPTKFKVKYSAVSPNNLINFIKKKENSVKKELKIAHELTKEIPSEINIASLSSKIQVLEGPDVVKIIWEDMLSREVDVQRQLIRMDTQEFVIDYYSGWVEDYIKRRIAKKIPLRYLTGRRWYGRKYTSTDSSALKEVRMLPDSVNISTNVVIYGDKFATHTIDPANLKGIIIHDKDIANTQKQLFDFLWENSK